MHAEVNSSRKKKIRRSESPRDRSPDSSQKKVAAEEIVSIFDRFSKDYGIDAEELLSMVVSENKRREEKKRDLQQCSPERIPLSIFKGSKLSTLEAVVKYMRENCGLNYPEIAERLGRNTGPIGITYRNSRVKSPNRFTIETGVRKEDTIPVSVFKDSGLSVLESAVSHLRARGYSLHEIAVIMDRDDRTIWTINHRAEKKIAAAGKKKNAGRKR